MVIHSGVVLLTSTTTMFFAIVDEQLNASFTKDWMRSVHT